jgi:hypothetical protein
MDINASCSQCDHEFDADEIFSVCINGECPVCGAGGVAEGDSGSGPFSYDPAQDFKTEQ